MITLRRLALITNLFAFAVVLMGSWTRINAAGLTCPDWPTCRHSLFPSLAGGTLWEWTHRLLAFALLPFLVALAVAVWKQRNASAFVLPTGIIVGLLFFVQVALGAATVDFANVPISVVLHWATAMALIASLAALAIFADAEVAPRRRGERSGLLLAGLSFTAILAFVTMSVGAYVSSSGAGLACLSLPGCAGNVVVSTPGQFVQMLHRAAAALTMLCAMASFALAWGQGASGRLRFGATIGLTLVFVQVVLGLLNVVLRLPPQLRELHAANAALVFLAFVAATLFALVDSHAALSPDTGEGLRV